ncbi:MAG: PTS fructose transporter subunit IIA [Neomegalonema sp.]|nr:PTS fructose transporter subunit IIA [Neomegalonema sp.]
MIGLIIVAHGGLADELLRAAEHVVGPLPAAKAVGGDLAEKLEVISAAVDEVDSGAGVVILTDLFGGTPSNLAIAAMARPGVDVVTGVNLPMLLKLAELREIDRREAVAAAVEAGRRYIMDVAGMLDPAAPKGET